MTIITYATRISRRYMADIGEHTMMVAKFILKLNKMNSSLYLINSIILLI